MVVKLFSPQTYGVPNEYDLTRGQADQLRTDIANVEIGLCGGPDAVENMQWQTIAEARARGARERKACGR